MNKRIAILLLVHILVINVCMPIISMAEQEEYEDEQLEIEEESNIDIDEIKNKDIDLDVRDIITSDSIIQSDSEKVRVAEVYSINNNLADCYYKPYMDEIDNLNAYILKYGKYAAAYMGFYDLGHKESPKPSGLQSRALEIIGYDCLLSYETYDITTKKYRRKLISDGNITEESAIMNIYKALGIELFDIKMYHEKANFTKENSPAVALLERNPVKYNLSITDGYGTLTSTDMLDSFNTYVFVSRTNPELYMRKLNQDFNIPMSQNKNSIITLADFIVMCKRMMEYYGEPVMNKTEMNQLLQVYGSKIPVGITDELRDAWLYLKARGVLEDDSGLFANLSIANMNDILMCIKDKNSRTNFKEIQVVMNLNDKLVNSGYYPDQITFTQSLKAPMEYEVDYSTAETYDYLIPIADEYAFKNSGISKANTMYISEDPDGMGTELSGSYYVGVVDNKYWHFIVPVDISRKNMKDDIYLRIESKGILDTPKCLYIEAGGGYYKKWQKIGNDYYFIRHNFENSTYEDYVDRERKNGTEFDDSKWNDKDNNNKDNIRLPNYDEDKKPLFPSVEDSDWDGIDYTYYKDASWELEKSTGKWRLYYKDDGEKMMASSEIVRVGTSNNISSEIYLLDRNGYCISGWYDWGSKWVFFNDGQVDGFKYGQMIYSVEDVLIDNEEYSFDAYGWLIGEEWDNPEEGDEWEDYDNLEGEWKKDEDKWWFMLSDGSWVIDGIEKINDELYMFDDEGYMLTGWQEWIDGNQYYFYPEDGNMARNTVTPDGFRVDLSGVPIGKEVAKIFNTPFIKNLLSYIKNGFAMTSYASENSGETTNLGYKQSDRWYTIKVPMELIDDSGLLDFQNWYEGIRLSKMDSNKPLRQGKNELGETVIVIQTKLRPDYVFSHIKYKNDSASYNLLSNVKTITSLDGNYLVNFDDLVQLGIFDEKITQNDKDKEIILYGITQRDGEGFRANGNEQSAQRQNGSLAQRSGFGEVILRNNVSDKRIRVGSTVYLLDDATEVFAFNIEDSSIEWEDDSDINRDSTIYGRGDKQLYVDFRVAYGWATSELNFYNCQTTSSDSGIAKNVVVTYGKNISTRGANIRNIKQSGLSGNSRTPFMVSLINGLYKKDENSNNEEDIKIYRTTTGKAAYLLPMVNNYSCASFAIVNMPSQNGGHNIMCIQYVPACESTKHMNKESDNIENLGRLKLPDFGDNYYRRIDNITNIVKEFDEDNIQEGSWYSYPNFGCVYCLPVYNSGVEAENDFYDKWLDESNNYLLPLCFINGEVVDMSMPYFPTVAKYGKQPEQIAQNNSMSCIPNVSGVSYLMWDEQMNKQSITELQDNESVSSRRYYFGSMIALINSSNSKTMSIPGLTSNNKVTELLPNVTENLKFIRVDTMYDYMYTGGSSGEANGFQIYSVVPESLLYDVVSSDDNKKSEVTVGSMGSATDLYKDYESFTFEELINKIDKCESIIILFSIVVLPYIGFTLSLIVFGISLCADLKLVQWFCNNVIDPIKILTFGQKDVNTVGGIKYFSCVLCVVIGFALVADGNILRVIIWLSAFITEAIRLFQML